MLLTEKKTAVYLNEPKYIMNLKYIKVQGFDLFQNRIHILSI